MVYESRGKNNKDNFTWALSHVLIKQPTLIVDSTAQECFSEAPVCIV